MTDNLLMLAYSIGDLGFLSLTYIASTYMNYVSLTGLHAAIVGSFDDEAISFFAHDLTSLSRYFNRSLGNTDRAHLSAGSAIHIRWLLSRSSNFR
jgi:hypothetical protein